VEIFIGILILAILAGLVTARMKTPKRRRKIQNDRISEAFVAPGAGVRVAADFTTSEGIAPQRRHEQAPGYPTQGTMPKDGDVLPKPPKQPLAVVGQLRHKRVHTTARIADIYNHYSTTCPVCLAEQSVFSEAIDSAGKEILCCLPCLLKYGGKQELEAAAKHSKYAQKVVKLMAALNQLCEEFPDPERRPYGGKTLLTAISDPVVAVRTDADTIMSKIKKRRWTERDLARIDGRPEPKYKSGVSRLEYHLARIERWERGPKPSSDSETA
jgi:hypothetical protein